MSAIEQISLLTASPNIQYIAFGIFTIAFGIVYAILYIDQFKGVRTQIEKWSTSIFGSKKSIDKQEPENEIADELENETNDIQENLSPF